MDSLTRKVAALTAAGAFFCAAGASAATLQVLDVEAYRASGDFSLMPDMTNMPSITYDTGLGTPVGSEDGNVFGGIQSYGAGDRYGYYDLGENWADLRIVETWSHTRTSAPAATNTPTGFNDLWWSNSVDKVFDPEAGDVSEDTLNFFLNTTTGQAETWFRDVQLTEETAVTPQGRYLIVMIGQGSTFGNSGVFSETAFVGYVIPEPASLALAGVGGLALLARRRR